MNGSKDKVSAWARTVGAWVGDSPWKAATFGVACAVAGAILQAWFG